MTSFRTVLINSGYLLGFRILTRIMSMIFLVYLASRLGPQLFGAFSFVLVTVELMTGIGDMGITRYGSRELVRAWDEKALWAGRIVILQILTSIPLAAVGLGLIFFYHPTYPKYQLLLIGLAAFFIYSLIAATESIFSASQKFFYSAFFTFMGRMIYMALGITALIMGKSVVIVMWGFLAAVVIETVLRLAVAKRITSFAFHFPAADLWRMMITTIPFAITAVTVVFSYRINLMILEFIKGDVATGIFNIAFTLYTPLVWVSVILATTTFPVFIKVFAEDRQAAQRNGWQLYRFMALAGIPAALFVTVLAAPILSFFPASYARSSSILVVLIWSLPVMLISSVDTNILQAIECQKEAANGQLLGATLAASFSLILIPFYGGLGAALAALISIAGQEIYVHWQVRRKFLHRFMFPLILRPMVGGLVMGAVMLLFMRINVWVGAFLGLAAYTAAILATGALRPSELKALVKG